MAAAASGGETKGAKSRRGLLVWVIAGAAAVLLAGWALWPKAVGVDAAAVTSGPMTVAIEEEGKTRIKDVFVVSAPQSGIVLRSPLLAGDPVTKGKTLVALLQPSQPPFLDVRTRIEATATAKAAEAAVRLSEAELEQARADLRFAEAEAKRAQTLVATKAASERQLEQAQHQAAVARAAVEKAEANVVVRRRQLESANARLISPDDETVGGATQAGCCVEVHSPVTGRVLRVHQVSEQVVPAGTPLAEVGDPRAIEIVVELLSTDAVKVAEGAHVDIVGWGGGEELTGTVTRIETAGFTKVSALGIEEQRVRVIVDLDQESRARH
ncbi:MAG: efflux RND transporter periplasmic adaptor subunit, partial [Hyphomicrobiaceae bacterium]